MQELIENTSLNSSSIALISASPTYSINPPCGQCANHSVCEASRLMDSVPDKRHFFLHPLSIAKSQHIFHAGEKLNTLYIVKSGLVKTYLISEAGDEQVMGFHMPGDLLGIDGLAYRNHSLSAAAVEASTVCAVTTKKLELVANRYEPRWLVQQVYRELLRERHILMITGKKYNTDARVALFLLVMFLYKSAY